MVVCSKCAREFDDKSKLREHLKLPKCDFVESVSVGLEDMTKPELIAYAKEKGIEIDPRDKKEVILDIVKEAESNESIS